MTSEFALEMNHIVKQFPGVRALDDVTIPVAHGETHALVGENGAGKSTLMKILDGVYPTGTYQGELRLNGSPLTLHSPRDARRKGIGFVPQEISVIEGLSVGENIFVGHWPQRVGVVGFRALYARAAQFLEERQIRLDPRQSVATLTASERQLMMIARALSLNPQVLILDEPTSSLTHDEAANLFRILHLLKTQGVTCLYISHKLEELSELADNVTVLRDGRVVARFPREGFTQQALIAAMVGRKIETLFPARDAVLGAEALRVENLTVPHPRLRRRNLVEGVSFSVRSGEILGLAGLVGSGRSEVVNAVYGRLPYRGEIYVDGKPARIRSPKDARRRGIALLTEERKKDGLLFNFAIRENITINSLPAVSRLGILDRQAETDAAETYMQRLAIRAPSVATMVATLSGGNQQKVVLAKALLAQPRILLLDEPTKGVDVGAKFEIYKLMAELARQGLALVVISSELPELLGLCDRFVVLANGKVADQFPASEADEHRLMRAATEL